MSEEDQSQKIAEAVENHQGLWLTITNVRLKAASKTTVEVQVQGDAGEAADGGPTWLECKECTSDAAGITAAKLYDKVVEALKNNRKVRGQLKFGLEGLVILEVEVHYQ